MTARESPLRLETCLHLCISHINKFSHCCIQTSLSALLHTTHSCHKHSDTQSTTRERERERKREGKEKEPRKEEVKKKGGGVQWREIEEKRKRDRSSVEGDAEMRMLRGGPALRNCAQCSVWPSRNLLKAGRRPAWMKEKWALVGCGIDEGRSGRLRVANTLNAWNIRTTCSFHEIGWAGECSDWGQMLGEWSQCFAWSEDQAQWLSSQFYHVLLCCLQILPISFLSACLDLYLLVPSRPFLLF